MSLVHKLLMTGTAGLPYSSNHVQVSAVGHLWEWDMESLFRPSCDETWAQGAEPCKDACAWSHGIYQRAPS